eukprot:gene17737-21148_t
MAQPSESPNVHHHGYQVFQKYFKTQSQTNSVGISSSTNGDSRSNIKVEEEDALQPKSGKESTGNSIPTMESQVTEKKRKHLGDLVEEEQENSHAFKRASFANNNITTNNNNNSNSRNSNNSIKLDASMDSVSSEANGKDMVEEIEEIRRERLERDKMLHDEVGDDTYQSYKYGDGEEGEPYMMPAKKMTSRDSGGDSENGENGGHNDDDNHHHHDDDHHSNLEDTVDHDNECAISNGNSNNNTDDESYNPRFAGESNNNTDDDSGNHDDGTSRGNSPIRGRNNNSGKSSTSNNDNDEEEAMLMDGKDEFEHDHHSTDDEANKSDVDKDEPKTPHSDEKLGDTIATSSHIDEDDDEDEDENDIPLRIQMCANNRAPKLTLSNVWLKTIPTDVWALGELRDLDLSANHLKKVSKSIGSLVHLKRLRLNHNQLSVLPKELYGLSRLTTLYLNNNNIKTMPKEIRNLTSLRILDLSFNQIADIPSSTNIHQMSSLVELRLRYNQLSMLPATLLEATQLQVLWLEGNRLPLPKAILKKTPIEMLTFLRAYKPTTKRAGLDRPSKNSPPTSIDAASTIAVAQVFAQKEIDIKKRKKENLNEIKKQHIEAEAKLKQLEEELSIANAKASKFEEEMHQLHLQQPTSLPAILLQQPQMWEHGMASPPLANTPPHSISPTLTSSNAHLHQQHLLEQQILQQQEQIQSQQQQIQTQQQFFNVQLINSPTHNFALPNTPQRQAVATPPPEKPFEWEVPFSELVLGMRIGRGGYGQVFRGSWRGTEIAVKMLFNDNMNPKLLSDLRKEVDLLCKLRHPNIVLFMGACTEPEHPCIVTEYLVRGSLANLLLDETVQMDWGVRLQLGLDLKTDNLLVDDSWQVKVADFGLATVKSHTFAKTMCGTTGWVAPEVLAEEGYTEKADVYSFAIVLWELLTRLIPYAGKNTMQVVRSIDRGERLSIPDWCPATYASLINRCWETDPAHRPSFPEILPMMEAMIAQYATEKKEAIAAGRPAPYVGPAKQLADGIAAVPVLNNYNNHPIVAPPYQAAILPPVPMAISSQTTPTDPSSMVVVDTNNAPNP